MVSIFIVKSKQIEKEAKSKLQTGLLLTDFLLRLLFCREDGGDIFLRMVGGLLPNYMATHHRRSYSSQSRL
jgi:hypothetical protein